jgi:hypothetical protein
MTLFYFDFVTLLFLTNYFWLIIVIIFVVFSYFYFLTLIFLPNYFWVIIVIIFVAFSYFYFLTFLFLPNYFWLMIVIIFVVFCYFYFVTFLFLNYNYHYKFYCIHFPELTFINIKSDIIIKFSLNAYNTIIIQQVN